MYVGPAGNVSKQFILPQRDPLYYGTCLQTFTVPEFLTEPVRVSALTLARAARAPQPAGSASPPEVSMAR